MGSGMFAMQSVDRRLDLASADKLGSHGGSTRLRNLTFSNYLAGATGFLHKQVLFENR